MAELVEITGPALDRRTPPAQRKELLRRVIEIRERYNMPTTQEIVWTYKGNRTVRRRRVFHEALARLTDESDQPHTKSA